MLPAWHWFRVHYDHGLQFHLDCDLADLQRQTETLFVFDLAVDLADVADRRVVLEPLERDDHDLRRLDDPRSLGGRTLLLAPLAEQLAVVFEQLRLVVALEDGLDPGLAVAEAETDDREGFALLVDLLAAGATNGHALQAFEDSRGETAVFGQIVFPKLLNTDCLLAAEIHYRFVRQLGLRVDAVQHHHDQLVGVFLLAAFELIRKVYSWKGFVQLVNYLRGCQVAVCRIYSGAVLPVENSLQ